MKIAVLTSRHTVSRNHKRRLRGITRLQVTTVHIVTDDQLNPLDVMLVFHRMSNVTNLNLVTTVDLLDYRNMLLRRRVGNSLSLQSHVLTATNKSTTGSMNNLNHVAANVTLVYLHSLSSHRFAP